MDTSDKKKQFNSAPCVVVTGASSGIGRATALRLDREGYRVFAGVRQPGDAEALRRDASSRLTPVSVDVTDAGSIESLKTEVEERVGAKGLQGLVNNAGIAISAVVEFLDIDELRYQLEVNLIGTVAVTRAFIPSIRQGKGRIVNVSSDSGLIATPFMAPYSMSKFGVEAFSDALRRELRRFDIPVVVVEPGAIATPMWGKGRARASSLRSSLSEEAQKLYGPAVDKFEAYLSQGDANATDVEVAAKTLHQVLSTPRPKARYQIGNDAKGLRFITRFMPTRIVDAIVAKTFS